MAEPTELVGRAETWVFHGPPADALEPLGRLLGDAARLPAPVAATATWLQGVALGALGRYAEALAVLEPALESTSVDGGIAAGLLGACVGSLLRQIGDHVAGEQADTRGLELAAPLGPLAAEATLDCLVGLTADAVGTGNLELAESRLGAARQAAAALPEQVWRPVIRLRWVEAEVALLGGDPPTALIAATAGVLAAEQVKAPRHIAKSLMFQGVAQLGVARPGPARTALLQAAALAHDLGLLPLTWPIRGVLATSPELIPEPELAAEHLAAARAAARAIAAGLPTYRCARWTSRDGLAALLLTEPATPS